MVMSIPAVEFGMGLCLTKDGTLTRGPVGVGDATSVQFPDSCPTGKFFASIHSHPKEGGGSILPSAQDMREAGRLQMAYLGIINNEKMSFYRVKGVPLSSMSQVPMQCGSVSAAQGGALTRLSRLLCK